MTFRTGFGYDVHPLKEGRKLYVGGILIPAEKGAVGHSDADVLIHAICDALLGAANMHDIGYHFPDSSREFKDIDSKLILKKTVKLIRSKGFSIVNIDSTVCLEKPRIASYVEDMKNILSDCMKIFQDQLSIKATTTEKLGMIGRGEGISAYATVLISKE